MPGLAETAGPGWFCTWGAAGTVRLPQATVPFRASGAGEPLVFVHGMYANGDWWRNVAPAFAASHRCIVPELPFGGHRAPAAPDADLTPPGLARVVADFIEALGLRDVTLVAGDLGGAVCQIVVAHRAERVARLVLTPCDSHENFPPRLLEYQSVLARLPLAAALVRVAARLARVRALRPLPILYGYATRGPLDHDLIDSYLLPVARSAAIRRDVVKLLRGVSNR